jgi:hypothetical protein
MQPWHVKKRRLPRMSCPSSAILHIGWHAFPPSHMIKDIVSFLVSLAKNKFVIPAKNKLFSLTYTFVSNINYKNLISYTD